MTARKDEHTPDDGGERPSEQGRASRRGAKPHPAQVKPKKHETMTLKTKREIREEKRHAKFFKDWQRMTANAKNRKTVIMQILADKYDISVKTAYDWRNKLMTTNN